MEFSSKRCFQYKNREGKGGGEKGRGKRRKKGREDPENCRDFSMPVSHVPSIQRPYKWRAGTKGKEKKRRKEHAILKKYTETVAPISSSPNEEKRRGKKKKEKEGSISRAQGGTSTTYLSPRYSNNEAENEGGKGGKRREGGERLGSTIGPLWGIKPLMVS